MRTLTGCIRGLFAFLLIIGAPWAVALEQLEVEYLRPGVDLSQYTQVMIHPLNLDRTKVIPPVWADDQNPKKWSPQLRDTQVVKDRFYTTIKSQVEQDARFKVVPFTGPGILEIEMKVTSITPFAKRDEKVITKGSGEISVRAEVVDGASGDLIAVLSGDQTVGEQYQEKSIDTDRANLDRLFTLWGKRLLDHLRAAQR